MKKKLANVDTHVYTYHNKSEGLKYVWMDFVQYDFAW